MALNLPSMFDTQYAMDRQMETDAMEAARAMGGGKRGGMYYNSSLGGDMYGQGLMALSGMMGGSPDPRIAKQQAIAEIQQRFPNPDTYKEFMELANALRLGGYYDYAEQAIKAANDIRSSEPSATVAKAPTSRNRNVGDMTITEQWNPTTMVWDKLSEAPRWKPTVDDTEIGGTLTYLESVGGFKLTPIEKKFFEERIKDTVSIGPDSTVIDTAVVVYNSIIKNRTSTTSDESGVIIDTTQTVATEKAYQEKLDSSVLSLSKELSNVGGVGSALSQMENKISKYRNEDGTYRDIPGFSGWETYTRGSEGDDNSALWENLLGEIRHERFGSVLTANEQKMFESIKTGNPLYLPDTAVIKFIERMRESINNKEAKIRSGYSEDVVLLHRKRSAIRITTEGEFDKLESGTDYVGPDGKLRVKP